MLLSALFSAALAADVGRIEACRRVFNVDIELSEPLFEGESRWQSDSCASGIPVTFHDAGYENEIAALRVETADDGRLRVIVEDLRHGVRLQRDGIAAGAAAVLEAPQAGASLHGSIRIAAATRVPTTTTVMIDVVNQPVDEVARALQRELGWTLRGLDHLPTSRVTLRFDAIPLRALLELVADVGNLDVESGATRDGKAVFRPRKPGAPSRIP